MLWLSFFLWFMVFNDVRFSSENWAGNIFLIAVCLSLWPRFQKTSQVILVGVLLGLAFLIRFQSAFLIIGFLLWLLFIKKETIAKLFCLCIPIVAIIALGVLIDHWFYGEWTLSCWNYFYQNIIMHKAAMYGEAPWWSYFTEITVSVIPPFSIIYPAAFLIFFYFYPKHILTFISVPFLLIHFIVGHKELRFMFPIAYFLPFVIVMAAGAILNATRLSAPVVKMLKVFIWGFWITDIALLLVIMFAPADGQISLYKTLYRNYPNPTTIYYTGDEAPYGKNVPIYFYRRRNMEIKHINSEDEIQPSGGKTILFAGFHPEIDKPGWQLIYTSLPKWLFKFDINHWQERSKVWYVYEVSPISNKQWAISNQ
jgi:phosphatidylinositol glycan class B